MDDFVLKILFDNMQQIADEMFSQFLVEIQQTDIEVVNRDFVTTACKGWQQKLYYSIPLTHCTDVSRLTCQQFVEKYGQDVYSHLLKQIHHKDVRFLTLQGPPIGYPSVCVLNKTSTMCLQLMYDHVVDQTFVNISMKVQLGETK